MLTAIKQIEWVRLTGLLGILVLAAVLRVHLTSSGVPGVVFPRHDEMHYVSPVVGFLQGRWKVNYFINPTLYIYLLYAATCLTGLALVGMGRYSSWDHFVTDVSLDPGLVTIVGRSLTLASSLASVVLVYCIGRRMFSPRVGWVAALALALDRTHVQSSTLAGNECVLVLLLLIFFLVLLRYVERPSIRLHVWCGILLGLAMSTKYSGGIHVFTLAVGSLFAASVAQSDSNLVARLCKPRYWVGFPCALAAFVVGSPWIVLAFDSFREAFDFQAAFLREGYTFRDMQLAERGWITYARGFPHGNQGMFFAVLCALGILAALWRTIRQRNSSCALLLTACLPAYLYLGSGIFSRMRFLLIAIPFALILGAWALDAIASGTVRAYDWVRKGAGSEWRNTLVVALLLLFLVPHARGLSRVQERVFGRDARGELLLWLREELEPQGIYLDLCVGTQRFFAMQRRAARLDPEKVRGEAVKQRLLELRERYVNSHDVQGMMRGATGIDEFRSALEDHPAEQLILISTRRTRGASSERKMLRQTLSARPKLGARLQTVNYWEDVSEFLSGLEIEAFTVARDRSMAIWILNLP